MGRETWPVNEWGSVTSLVAKKAFLATNNSKLTAMYNSRRHANTIHDAWHLSKEYRARQRATVQSKLVSRPNFELIPIGEVLSFSKNYYIMRLV